MIYDLELRSLSMVKQCAKILRSIVLKLLSRHAGRHTERHTDSRSNLIASPGPLKPLKWLVTTKLSDVAVMRAASVQCSHE